LERFVRRHCQAPRSLRADQHGVVFVEFLIAFVPMWTFFLCVVQLAFIAHANLMVKHSADSAARSAVVVLPDDPNEYGGEPEMSIGRGPVTASDIGGALGRVGSALQGEPSTGTVVAAFSDETIANLGRSRLNTIRLAAHVPLMPLAPVNVGRDTRASIAKAIGDGRKLVSALYYQPFALAVTFPGQQDGVVAGSEVTVRVTYAYQCTVPLARRILCRAFRDIEGRDELEEAFFPYAQTFVGGRFHTLQHDTTLMIHDAPYDYRVRGA
jgi:Flp pilus assembly protein TadG